MSAFKLLSVGNPKTIKGEKRGYLTFILHLAPGSLSGFNVCPMATQGCLAVCLNTAGRGGILSSRPVATEIGTVSNPIQAARIRKTRAFFADRQAFMWQLEGEIRKAIRHAAKRDLTPVFRLNGTSDIRWERMAVGSHPNLMAMFPGVQFYDYTKIANRKDLPANYALTFSLADGNDDAAATAMYNGHNVAAVFFVKRGQPMPALYGVVPVVDGDESDLRFLDARQSNGMGLIVGLRAKGKAKRDQSGFVRSI